MGLRKGYVRDRVGLGVRDRFRGCVRVRDRVRGLCLGKSRVGLGERMQLWICGEKQVNNGSDKMCTFTNNSI